MTPEGQEAVEEQIEVDKRRSSKRLRVGVMEADRRLSPRAWVGVGRGGNGGVIEVGKRRFPQSSRGSDRGGQGALTQRQIEPSAKATDDFQIEREREVKCGNII